MFVRGCGTQQSILINDADWTDVEFEVALDSGSTSHVCHIVGNGARVPNDGQSVLNLQETTTPWQLHSI